jgi:hypothetical protein
MTINLFPVKPPAAATPTTPAAPKPSVSSKIMPSMGVDATEQAIVDTDAEKLLSHACINYLKDGTFVVNLLFVAF